VQRTAFLSLNISCSHSPLFCCSPGRSPPPGADPWPPYNGSIPAPDGSGRRVWAPPSTWVAAPQVIIRDCTLVIPSTEVLYW
jgi:hypothetical protein